MKRDFIILLLGIIYGLFIAETIITCNRSTITVKKDFYPKLKSYKLGEILNHPAKDKKDKEDVDSI